MLKYKYIILYYLKYVSVKFMSDKIETKFVVHRFIYKMPISPPFFSTNI